MHRRCMGLGLATFLGWLIVGAPWQTALTYAIAVLIITCPCALALAVPAVQIAAASRLFRQGIVIKAADGLERVAEADMVVFDKTGTLTLGRPELVNDAAISDEVLESAARLAAASKHPYAQAVVAAARNRQIAVGGAGGRRGDTRSRPGAHFALRRGAAWVCGMVRHCPRPRRCERGVVRAALAGTGSLPFRRRAAQRCGCGRPGVEAARAIRSRSFPETARPLSNRRRVQAASRLGKASSRRRARSIGSPNAQSRAARC